MLEVHCELVELVDRVSTSVEEVAEVHEHVADGVPVLERELRELYPRKKCVAVENHEWKEILRALALLRSAHCVHYSF
jgi:hypothetical protein